jgi:hypothetical protein
MNLQKKFTTLQVSKYMQSFHPDIFRFLLNLWKLDREDCGIKPKRAVNFLQGKLQHLPAESLKQSCEPIFSLCVRHFFFSASHLPVDAHGNNSQMR